MAQLYLALGSNLGNRKENLDRAIQEIQQRNIAALVRVSAYYETDPVGDVAQGKFLNAVAAWETNVDPSALLHALQALEKDLGREKTIRWGPRLIDLDILSYDSVCLQTEALTIPHPELHRRQFVLEPLCEICPDWMHPLLQRTAVELWREWKTMYAAEIEMPS